MIYDKFLSEMDSFRSEINKLKTVGKTKEADLKKLEMLYVKVNYYEECVNSSKEHTSTKHSYENNLNSALNELANYRDYLWEQYQYEEV